jgi:endogenous inhibitor of DNA gyrase (YacG/DUF329 family)
MPSHACPTCKKKIEYGNVADVAAFPFCGERCRLVDLGRWLDEGYVISQAIAPEDRQGVELEDQNDDGAADPRPPSASANEADEPDEN